MKIILSTIALFFFSLQIGYTQISYQDLSNYLEMDKDKITLSLKKLDQNWKYIESPSDSNSEKWINSGTTISIKNFKIKENRKLEYYTKNSDVYKKIIREMGSTNQYKEVIIEETPKVIYNFWHSQSKTAVGHIICSETDTVCYLQLDLMQNISFKKSDYK